MQHLLLGPPPVGDVGVRADHALRATGCIALHHTSAREYPAPFAVAVPHTELGLVVARIALEMGGQPLACLGTILRVHQLAPGGERHAQFPGRIAQDLQQPGAELRLVGADVPLPHRLLHAVEREFETLALRALGLQGGLERGVLGLQPTVLDLGGLHPLSQQLEPLGRQVPREGLPLALPPGHIARASATRERPQQ